MTTPPAGRYGPAPTVRTVVWRRAGLAVLVLAALGGLAWVGLHQLTDPVQWSDVGYHVNGPTSIDVTFDVTKAPSASATCHVSWSGRAPHFCNSTCSCCPRPVW